MKQRIIAVSNCKGGVGKTTIAVNLAAGLARRERRVLVVDADPQSNATYALLGTIAEGLTLHDVVVAGCARLADVIVSTRSSGVDLVPGHINLSAADLALAAVPGRERLLARKLRDAPEYDYIIVDTPPSLGLMGINSMIAAGEVFVPVGIGAFALLGIGILEDTVAQIHDNMEMETPVITGAIANLYDRTRIADDTLDALRAHFGERLFRSVIPRLKDVQESQSRATSIFAYAPKSPAAMAYLSLVEEVIHGEK
ncbi:sporulation initiation inhibitor Soj [bacterium]|nr:ParA family protein [Chloroflexi bacterium CFX6]RIL12701.1 MAG: sporulation initiation inhibitor Soj [bacterium]